jgi:hypothetical protein
MNPEAGAAIRPGVRPHGAEPWLWPVQRGAIVTAYALTIWQGGRDVPVGSRRDCVASRWGTAMAA